MVANGTKWTAPTRQPRGRQACNGKASRRKKIGQPRKGANKNPDLTYHRAIVRRDQAQAVIDRYEVEKSQVPRVISSPEPTTRLPSDASPVTEPTVELEPADDFEKRVMVKFYYRELGCPPEEDWSGTQGTVAEIRRRIGPSAPSIQMVRRTLTRLAAGDTDVWVSKRGGTGRPRILSHVDDLLVGLLAVEGQSQRNATRIVNSERRLLGLPDVDRKQIREAEERVRRLEGDNAELAARSHTV